MKSYGNPAELVPRMKEVISCSEGFWLVVTGNSMVPTLKHLRDRVYISPFNRKANKGDILLTELQGKHCHLHKVIKCEGDMIFYNGDSLTYCEGPLPVSNVIGIVTKLERKGKVIPVNNFYYKLWSAFWQKTIRFRRIILRIYNKLKRLSSKLYHN
jgi:signal peptidase I